MKLVPNLLVNNPCYKANKKIKVKGLMLHSVGTPQPDAHVFLRNWNKSSYGRACVHAFVDANDGTVYQCLPWDHRGWHAGGSGNDTHIGVEMCEPGSIKYTSGSSFTCSNKEDAIAAAKRTYQASVELFAFLCKMFDLNPLTDICSHKEGHKKGISSNHGDPEHLWKGLGLSYTMDTFRAAVKQEMGNEAPKVESDGAAKEPEVQNNKISLTPPFSVKVLVSDLNYRKEPSMSGDVLGQTGKGSFTITQVKNGWGKLKSGAGWIYLENPQYVKIGKAIKEEAAQPPKEVVSTSEYKVRVTVNALNIRAGAGTSYAVRGVIRDKGIYTIVETKSGWGKLKSGAGWISLSYTKRV